MGRQVHKEAGWKIISRIKTETYVIFIRVNRWRFSESRLLRTRRDRGNCACRISLRLQLGLRCAALDTLGDRVVIRKNKGAIFNPGRSQNAETLEAEGVHAFGGMRWGYLKTVLMANGCSYGKRIPGSQNDSALVPASVFFRRTLIINHIKWEGLTRSFSWYGYLWVYPENKPSWKSIPWITYYYICKKSGFFLFFLLRLEMNL